MHIKWYLNNTYGTYDVNNIYLYTTVNIDECASSPCVYGSCTDRVNQYMCICEPGFQGTQCEGRHGLFIKYHITLLQCW